VTEKTDGVRQLMVVVGSGSGTRAVFVDRGVDRDASGRSYGLQVRACPGPALLPAGSVLDGELVFNFTLKKHVYMVFDLLQVWEEEKYTHIHMCSYCVLYLKQLHNYYLLFFRGCVVIVCCI
jgi:hypothetical protein